MLASAFGGVIAACAILLFRETVVDFIYKMNRRNNVIINREIIAARVTVASLFLLFVGIAAILKEAL